MRKVLSVVLAFILAIAIVPVFSGIQAHAADYRVEAAIEWAIATANDDTHGYSMSSRHGPNYDCSSFVSYAFKNAGFAIKGVPNSSSIISVFSKVGFKSYKKGTVTPRRGDIYVQPGSHVELYLGDGYCAGAHENTDGKSGDSKGNEIDIRHTSKCSWCRNQQYTYILRYEGPETYTYSFSYNSLNGETNSDAFTVTLGKSFTIEHTASKNGYNLSGWCVQRRRDNTWYTVNGWLTEEQIFQNELSKAVFENGTKIDFGESWTSSYSCDTEYVFYAVWVPDKYTVTFDANGGINTPAPQTKLHGSDLGITSNIPAKDGFAFLGWAESPNATIPTYLPGAAFYSNTNTTLYAVWGSTITGDLYGDGRVDTSDFALFKIMLSSYSVADNQLIFNADINNDGTVDVSDMATMKLQLSGI